MEEKIFRRKRRGLKLQTLEERILHTVGMHWLIRRTFDLYLDLRTKNILKIAISIFWKS